MEESLRVRIDKIFGSLSSSSSPSPSSLWCLAEDEINGNERSKEEKVSDEPEPFHFDPNSFPDIQEDDLEDLSVDEEEGQSSSVSEKPEDYDDEEWEIKNSIGMDPTLDMEEEEDENDKVAIAEELYGFTNDVNDYETEADEWEEFPVSLKERDKDPRANLEAAKLRLKEDAEAVHKLNSLHVSEVHEGNNNLSMLTSGNEKAMVVSDDNKSQEVHVGLSDDNGLKPILKRKENQADAKLQKRVRFSSDIGDDDKIEGDKDSAMETSLLGENIVVPDYMRNPAKYTKYTFDSGEVDEESNRKAYVDFLNMIRRRDEPLVDPMLELPKSVAFVPKKKPTAESKVENVDKVSEGKRRAIAIVDTIEDSTVSAMDEDEPDAALNVVRKPDRQYRTRATEDQEEC